MNYTRVILIALTLIVGGCAAPVSKNYSFDSTKTEGLVVMGLKYENMPIFHFREYDPETGEVLDGRQTVNLTGDFGGTQSSGGAIVFPVEAGNWFLSHYSVTRGMTETTVSLGAGTFAFNANPGEIVYIGEFELTRLGIRRLSPDLPKARAKIATFKKVDAEMAFPLPKNVSYTCDRDARSIVGIKIARCVPLKVSSW